MTNSYPTTTDGQCRCGCGGQTGVVNFTWTARGIVKGQYASYIPGHGRRNGVQYVIDDKTGCWIWNLRKNKQGYGTMRDGDNPSRLAHRVFYERAKGDIPAGLVLDHLCRNRACVNPDHLEPVTNRENCIDRGIIHNAHKTHCPKGHPYDETNTKIDKRSDGGDARRCRICRSAERRARYLREGR